MTWRGFKLWKLDLSDEVKYAFYSDVTKDGGLANRQEKERAVLDFEGEYLNCLLSFGISSRFAWSNVPNYCKPRGDRPFAMGELSDLDIYLYRYDPSELLFRDQFAFLKVGTGWRGFNAKPISPDTKIGITEILQFSSSVRDAGRSVISRDCEFRVLDIVERRASNRMISNVEVGSSIVTVAGDSIVPKSIVENPAWLSSGLVSFLDGIEKMAFDCEDRLRGDKAIGIIKFQGHELGKWFYDATKLPINLVTLCTIRQQIPNYLIFNPPTCGYAGYCAKSIGERLDLPLGLIESQTIDVVIEDYYDDVMNCSVKYAPFHHEQVPVDLNTNQFFLYRIKPMLEKYDIGEDNAFYQLCLSMTSSVSDCTSKECRRPEERINDLNGPTHYILDAIVHILEGMGTMVKLKGNNLWDGDINFIGPLLYAAGIRKSVNKRLLIHGASRVRRRSFPIRLVDAIGISAFIADGYSPDDLEDSIVVDYSYCVDTFVFDPAAETVLQDVSKFDIHRNIFWCIAFDAGTVTHLSKAVRCLVSKGFGYKLIGKAGNGLDSYLYLIYGNKENFPCPVKEWFYAKKNGLLIPKPYATLLDHLSDFSLVARLGMMPIEEEIMENMMKHWDKKMTEKCAPLYSRRLFETLSISLKANLWDVYQREEYSTRMWTICPSGPDYARWRKWRATQDDRFAPPDVDYFYDRHFY